MKRNKKQTINVKRFSESIEGPGSDAGAEELTPTKPRDYTYLIIAFIIIVAVAIIAIGVYAIQKKIQK